MNNNLKRFDLLPDHGAASAAGQPKALAAYNFIRHAIITMRMQPGTTISEKETCAQLGVSRTPMREAVLRLNQPENLLAVAEIDQLACPTMFLVGAEDRRRIGAKWSGLLLAPSPVA